MSTSEQYVIGVLAMALPACCGFVRWRRSIRDGKGFPVPHELVGVVLAGLMLVSVRVSDLLYTLSALGGTAYMIAYCFLLCPSPVELRAHSPASRRRIFLVLMGMLLVPYLIALGAVLYLRFSVGQLD